MQKCKINSVCILLFILLCFGQFFKKVTNDFGDAMMLQDCTVPWRYRIWVLAALAAGVWYLWWLWNYLDWFHPVLAVSFLVAELSVWGFFAFSFLTHFFGDGEAHRFDSNTRPSVAVLIPTVNESCDILRQTIKAAKLIDYDRFFVMVSDDGRREEVARLAHSCGVRYHVPAEHQNAKAGNLNSALAVIRTTGIVGVLVQDADEIADSAILKKLTGYFSDPRVAWVQARRDMKTPPGDPFGARTHFFMNVVLRLRDRFAGSFSVGSGVLWRVAALDSIGGFSTWNIVEDLHTSLRMHEKGYCGVLHPEVLSVGIGAGDMGSFCKQYFFWAMDGLRILLFDNPLFKKTIPMRIRLFYAETVASYLLAWPSLYFLTLPFYLLAVRAPLLAVPSAFSYLAASIPYFFLSGAFCVWYSYRMQGGFWYTHRVRFMILSPLFVAALATVLWLGPKRKIRYRVTEKVWQNQTILSLIPYIVAAALSCFLMSAATASDAYQGDWFIVTVAWGLLQIFSIVYFCALTKGAFMRGTQRLFASVLCLFIIFFFCLTVLFSFDTLQSAGAYWMR